MFRIKLALLAHAAWLAASSIQLFLLGKPRCAGNVMLVVAILIKKVFSPKHLTNPEIMRFANTLYEIDKIENADG